jgi:hypothetical protein
MANYNKSFNFRNGVQVDNDNFIVNANGLVGIGTSIPTESLDVHGTTKVTGLVTARNLAITGVSTFYSNVNVGSGITLNASTGIVSATAFYGSAASLTGIYAIAVDGWYVNAGNLSTTSKVGIGTTLPNYSLQVGQDPITGNGLSIDALTGNVNTTGILTAPSFVGTLTGNLTGNVNSIGISTFSTLKVGTGVTISGGIVTATSFVGSLTGTVTGNVTGIASTALSLSGTPNIIVGFATATQFIGNVTGIASTALSLSGSPSITVTNINATNSGIITAVNIVSGISSVGVSTVSTRLYAESIGVGTNSPSSDVHVRRSSISRLQITSDTAEAIIAIGRSTTLTGSNSALRFGNTSSLQRYSSTKSLDIINYDTGNINSYLQLGSTGINTGSFHWIYGQITPNVPIMTLTYDGKLGIGVTLPTNNLHIVGTSTVTSNAYVGNSLYIGNNLNVYGTLSLVNPLSGNVTGNVTGNLTGNVNATTGISTFNGINASVSNIQNLGIGGSAVTYPFEVGSGTEKIVMNGTAIGIGTTSILENIGLDASNVFALAQGIGIGTTAPMSNVDFANAGTGADDDLGKRFMIPPKVSSADRVGLNTVEGGVIYNTTVRRLELYLGNDLGWVGIATIV